MSFASRKKFESMQYRSWKKCTSNQKIFETNTLTHCNCQGHWPYPLPRNLYDGIRRIRQVVLQNIGGVTAPPLPPFPALLLSLIFVLSGISTRFARASKSLPVKLISALLDNNFSKIFVKIQNLVGPQMQKANRFA